ncbi:MAG TPA: hypothetical protein VN131_06720 [Mobilitalea sp.]|nr:hypothetical protein [Mobilitalea sp.]
MRIIKKLLSVIIHVISDITGYKLPLLTENGIHKPWKGIRLGDK